MRRNNKTLLRFGNARKFDKYAQNSRFGVKYSAISDLGFSLCFGALVRANFMPQCDKHIAVPFLGG
jgi:hypothetical protein